MQKLDSDNCRAQVPAIPFFVALLVAVLMTLDSSSAFAQTNENFLKNGSLEDERDGAPADWSYRQGVGGYEYSIDTENPFEGDKSAMVDATIPDKENGFTTFNQSFDAEPFRGKKVRFRAAVRTAERDPSNGQACLWLRVDRDNGEQGAFDNMANRPVKSDDWQQVEIVAKVDNDARRLTVGMIVSGKTKAWIDDASLEIVPDDTKTTARDLSAARRTASNGAPTEPFFNAWLLLAAVTVATMFYATTGNSFFQRFALRFSIVYWVCYCFPRVFSSLYGAIVVMLDRAGVEVGDGFTKPVSQFLAWYSQQVEKLSNWTAQKFFGFDAEMVSAAGNGSGDTTMAYMQLLIGFAIAIAIAIVWTLVMIKRTKDQVWIRDIHRTYLRYFVAATMLSYGLSKTGFIQTQFATGGVPNEFQLNRTYGDSSPMGLLWTFMAASPAYTFFAGLGEVLGGVLLVFRRTATLGALVTFGVMLNVMMLNFCYDVPVKLFSFHLVVMTLLIAAPDFRRLANVLFFNRPTVPTTLLRPPYTGPRSIWAHRIVKSLVVIALVVIPVYQQAKREITHEHVQKMESEHLLIKRGFRWINEMPFNR